MAKLDTEKIIKHNRGVNPEQLAELVELLSKLENIPCMEESRPKLLPPFSRPDRELQDPQGDPRTVRLRYQF